MHVCVVWVCVCVLECVSVLVYLVCVGGYGIVPCARVPVRVCLHTQQAPHSFEELDTSEWDACVVACSTSTTTQQLRWFGCVCADVCMCVFGIKCCGCVVCGGVSVWDRVL